MGHNDAFTPDVTDTGYTGLFNQTMPTLKARELIRGYQASVSYVDSMGTPLITYQIVFIDILFNICSVGSVINKVKEKGYWESTVILLWSDHGYKLGDLSEFPNQTPLVLLLLQIS